MIVKSEWQVENYKVIFFNMVLFVFSQDEQKLSYLSPNSQYVLVAIDDLNFFYTPKIVSKLYRHGYIIILNYAVRSGTLENLIWNSWNLITLRKVPDGQIISGYFRASVLSKTPGQTMNRIRGQAVTLFRRNCRGLMHNIIMPTPVLLE
jgi:hypothetical protein